MGWVTRVGWKETQAVGKNVHSGNRALSEIPNFGVQ